MVRRALVVVAALLLLAQPSGVARTAAGARTQGQSEQQPPQPKGTGRIAGTVTCADTGKPIPAAVVQLQSAGTPQPARTKSDDRGHFEFSDLVAGTHVLVATADGYVPLDATVNRPSGIGKPLTLADGQRIDNADVKLAVPGAIEGRVVDEFGDPAPGVTIQLGQMVLAWGRPTLLPGSPRNGSGPTDDQGRFRFSGLPPGEYYVMALSGPFGRSNNSAFSSPGEGLAGFAPTYFPGTDKAGSAKPVVVEVGAPTPAISFALVAAPMSTVSGTVTDTAGQPIARANLMLLQTQGGEVRSMIPANTVTAADGTFSYRNIPPGTYVLQSFGPRSFGSAPITVPAGGDPAGVTGVAVTNRPLTSARGRLTFEGTQPPPPTNRVTVGFIPTDWTSGPAGGNRIPSHVNDDWTFEINDLAWTGLIRVSAVAPWRMKSVTRGGKDIADTPSDFQTSDVNDLEVVMTTDTGGSVGGTVSDGNKPITSYGVAIYSDDPAKWIAPSRFIKYGRPNAQGAFSVPDLLPGAYLAVAVPILPTNQGEIDREWLKAMAPRASTFRISGTESVILSLRLIQR